MADINTPILTHNHKERYNKILQDIIEFYDENTKKLVYYLYTKNYTYRMIGDILGFDQSAIAHKYPKNRSEVNKNV